MSGKFDDRNRGAIWKNEKKETEKHPDFTGSLNVDGRDYWVSAWKRRPDAADRAPALSFAIKPKDGKPMNAPRGETAPTPPVEARRSMKHAYPV
jgi:hypothetical protein